MRISEESAAAAHHYLRDTFTPPKLLEIKEFHFKDSPHLPIVMDGSRPLSQQTQVPLSSQLKSDELRIRVRAMRESKIKEQISKNNEQAAAGGGGGSH